MKKIDIYTENKTENGYHTIITVWYNRYVILQTKEVML